ncbi:MAG: hypothetical protein O3C57_06155 [Verrucomicrobia bacterium]|nr:hypothetical protein [Verrucomicrobiota bacterium]
MDKTQWFTECGWGVFAHWLGAPASSEGGAELSSEAWNRRVDAFDVEGLAQQLESIHAPYFFITIGQNSGHFIAPNATYDELVGIKPSKCSRRDLVSDLYDRLHTRGIELLVYLPSGAPAADPVAVSRLGWEWGFPGAWPHSWGPERTGERLIEFQTKWEAIIRDWSLRWGTKIRGWWIDGCYFADQMYRHADAPNFKSFAEATRAGNPDSIVAFNPGVCLPVEVHTEYEDYTAGEVMFSLPECPGAWLERNGRKVRYHSLSYLGSDWGKGAAPRYPDELAAGYTKYVTGKGGVMTWDVPVEECGLIRQSFMPQLRAIYKCMQSQ